MQSGFPAQVISGMLQGMDLRRQRAGNCSQAARFLRRAQTGAQVDMFHAGEARLELL
jgi:hypothetical protein